MYQQGKSSKINIYEDESPEVTAHNFALSTNLNEQQERKIAQAIRVQKTKFLEKNKANVQPGS